MQLDAVVKRILAAAAGTQGPLRADTVEPVGHYALRIRFSDGHDTGLYAWKLLRELAAQAPESQNEPA
jgi:DUF971 family protein